MFITFLSIFVLSICFLAYKVFNDQFDEGEAERQALIASIEKLRTKPRGTFETKDINPHNPLKKRGRPKKS